MDRWAQKHFLCLLTPRDIQHVITYHRFAFHVYILRPRILLCPVDVPGRRDQHWDKHMVRFRQWWSGSWWGGCTARRAGYCGGSGNIILRILSPFWLTGELTVNGEKKGGYVYPLPGNTILVWIYLHTGSEWRSPGFVGSIHLPSNLPYRDFAAPYITLSLAAFQPDVVQQRIILLRQVPSDRLVVFHNTQKVLSSRITNWRCPVAFHTAVKVGVAVWCWNHWQIGGIWRFCNENEPRHQRWTELCRTSIYHYRISDRTLRSVDTPLWVKLNKVPVHRQSSNDSFVFVSFETTCHNKYEFHNNGFQSNYFSL